MASATSFYLALHSQKKGNFINAARFNTFRKPNIVSNHFQQQRATWLYMSREPISKCCFGSLRTNQIHLLWTLQTKDGESVEMITWCQLYLRVPLHRDSPWMLWAADAAQWEKNGAKNPVVQQMLYRLAASVYVKVVVIVLIWAHNYGHIFLLLQFYLICNFKYRKLTF